MKNKILIFIIFAILGSGCKKSLELTPTTPTAASFYTTPAEFNDALTAAYSPLQTEFGLPFQYIYYQADDDIVSQFAMYNDLNWLTTDGQIQSIYYYLSVGVYRCNIIFQNIQNPAVQFTSASPYSKNVIIGQAEFLRALYDFYFSICFYEPPLINHVLQPNEYGIQKNSTQKAFYSSIASDLTDAASKLPASWGSTDIGRATSGAAWGLLGKMYMYAQNWDSAEICFNNVINSGQYSLIQPTGLTNTKSDSILYISAYLQNFQATHKNNSESLFEVQFLDDIGTNGFLPGWLAAGSMLSAYFSLDGYKNIAPRSTYASQFESPGPVGMLYDPRKYGTVFVNGDIMIGDNPAEYPLQGLPFEDKNYMTIVDQGFGVKKYYYPQHYNKVDITQADPDNWRLLRYDDILLMYAEADLQLNRASGTGLQYLNSVRARSGMPPIAILTPAAIMHERQVELGLECLRYHDLVRWSLLPNNSWGVSVSNYIPTFVKGKNEYLPIPQYEIDYMNGNLKQNPGY
jgi:hypothetical protein